MQLKNKTYKITNPTRRTYIVNGHQLKGNQSIIVDNIDFNEPSLVIEEIKQSFNVKEEVKTERKDKKIKKIGDE